MAVTRDFAELVQSLVSDRNDAEIVLRNIISRSEYPVIVTNNAFHPMMWGKIDYGSFFNRKTIPGSHLNDHQQKILLKKAARFRKNYPPLPLRWGEGGRLSPLRQQPLISSLVFLPLWKGTHCVLFVLAYFTFHTIRITENNLWVGLAKETAHQLGTPISSLMGWVEYIRTVKDADPPLEPQVFLDQSQRICDDMDNDLHRLRKVTARFSQIGSIPTLTSCDINDNLREVAEYFRMRLPLLRKRIEINFDLGEIPPVSANRDLIEWVFEIC